ncbi:IQ domain-containing protein IQM1 [Sorghum bicolor]|uniref:Calmodulin-binding family protein n=1 Tax=Sorghum bicolor TaxID=4558 RepID=C5YX01_SORBI|nr:IQ domain-containing protein IQM1 [Sorghum bicolor]EES18807.2 hypothetical protein SORBI_3009G257100 [Sorghum bicolor]|eukprot:XP_002440378.2 IQ domain-containing protein IQM1 [Sorghum bicolor]
MTLLSPPGALIDHPKLLPTSPSSSSSSRDHRLIFSTLSVVDDMPMPMPMLPRSPKLLRTNSSKKVPAASNLERALLSFKSWETIDDATKPAAVPIPIPPSPVQRRIHGARPGRLALHSPTMAAAAAADDNSLLLLRSPLHEAAATRVQKMFKGHRTRRTLADCAIVIEELWWKLCDSASLDRTSISFFTATAGGGKQETAASRWVRAGKRIAKVGKGLSKDDKAQKLALRHWLEAIDPRHRYGHNLHLYYDIWFQSSSTEPFFYWLDIGGGREIHHPSCPRTKLNSQLVMYLGINERAAYQVVVDDGRLTYLQTGLPVNTTDDSKWIFVLSTTRSLYVGQKRKGHFQHSSFLAGGATSAAGRLVAKDGVLKAIWPYSGHYLPTEENFNEFIAFLQENNLDLTDVKRCSVDDDEYPSLKRKHQSMAAEEEEEETAAAGAVVDGNETAGSRAAAAKWTTGAGARIGCVRDYPAELQSRALEQVNLSPNRPKPPCPLQSPWAGKAPIPSPRPSPRIRLSPRVQYMGVPAASPAGVRPPPHKQQCLGLGLGIRPPTVHLTLPSNKNGSKATSTTSPANH